MKFFYALARFLNRRPVQIKKSKIDKKAKVGNGAQVVFSSIGKYSYVYNSKLIHCVIGSFCSIGEECVIGGGCHPIDWVSTSPVFYANKNVLKKTFSEKEFQEYKKTIIGNDVWIGSKCLIKAGVQIGDGAIIGMGSVVTHDVPPYEVWAGCPAHFIKRRFEQNIVDDLLRCQWWNFDDATIKKYSNYFDCPEKTIEILKKDGLL